MVAPLLELGQHARILAEMSSAALVTVGNELVSGDVENTNGSWLARRLAGLGVEVELIAVLPDEIERVAAFVREQAAAADLVIVTGGLGGTPDDVTREAIAAAFGVPQVEQPEVADRLRARFQRDPEYAARWAQLPEGSRALENPLGGAPGFAIGNVYVLPGLAGRDGGDVRDAGGGVACGHADRLLASHLPDDGEPDRRRARGDGRAATPGSWSARTPASTRAAARSRSSSSRPTPTCWRPQSPGSSPS